MCCVFCHSKTRTHIPVLLSEKISSYSNLSVLYLHLKSVSDLLPWCFKMLPLSLFHFIFLASNCSLVVTGDTNSLEPKGNFTWSNLKNMHIKHSKESPENINCKRNKNKTIPYLYKFIKCLWSHLSSLQVFYLKCILWPSYLLLMFPD